jgi:DNA segregation ATPase FtsK/SpoIIIE, S-DNA-T family
MTPNDPLYRDAKRLVVKHNKATVIFLQKHLFIDFDRACKILDDLESEGVVGPASGAEPRKVLVKE